MDLSRRILDAARELLVSHGYEAVSMRRIADQVGVTATSLYLHYDNKDALFQALVDEGMELLFDALSASIRKCEQEEGRVAALCRAYVEFGIENPEYYDLMFVIRPTHMERFPAEKYRKARRNLDLLIEALVDDASGRSREEIRLRATIVWASLHGTVALINARRVDRSLSAGDLITETVEFVLAGLRHRPSLQSSGHAL
jgi:AcrR family transcriptional regulator